MFGCVRTLHTSTRAGQTCGSWGLTGAVGGALGGHTSVVLTLLTCLALAVGVAIHTLLGGGVTEFRRTIGVLGTSGVNTHIVATGLQRFTVGVFGTSNTLVVETYGSGWGVAVVVGATSTGLRHTGIGANITQLPCSAVGVDHAGITGTAAQLTALLRGISGTVSVRLTASAWSTYTVDTERLVGIFVAVAVLLTFWWSCFTLVVFANRLGWVAIRIGLTFGWKRRAHTIQADGLGGIGVFALFVGGTSALLFAVTSVTGQTRVTVSVCGTRNTSKVLTLGFGGVFTVCVGLTLSSFTLAAVTNGLGWIFTVAVLEALRTAGLTLAVFTRWLRRIGTLCI